MMLTENKQHLGVQNKSSKKVTFQPLPATS